MLSCSAILLISLDARAQDAPAPDASPSEATPPEAPPASTALLQAAATALDPASGEAERVAAAEALARSGDPAALSLLEAATDARAADVQIAALGALLAAPGPEAARLADRALRAHAYEDEVRREAARVLGALQIPEAGLALWSAAGDRALEDRFVRLATEELERSYPALLAERGEPEVVTNGFAVVLGSAGSGMTGAVLLSSVGVWGRNEAAAVIGGIGGGIIGVGTGALYGATRPVSLGQGLAFSSGSGWGFAGSLYASNAALGPRPGRYPYEYYEVGERDEEEERRRWNNGAAGLRLAGALGGATAGWFWQRRDPTPQDVLEVDLSGYLGLQLGLAAFDLADERPRNYDCYLDRSPGTDVLGEDSCDLFTRRVKVRNAAGLGGLALGLGAGALASRGWTADWSELLFGSVVGLEAGWVGLWAPTALGLAEPDGNLRIGLHAGLAGGMAAAHLLEPDPARGLLTGWGAVLGNGLGAGLPLLLGADEQVVSGVMIPVGLAGTVAGAVVAPSLDLRGGDMAMLGVGVPLGVAEGATLAAVLADRGAIDGDQTAGLVLTMGALTGAGLTALTVPYDPDPADMLFLGSAATWGAWYGVLTPMALDLTLDDGDTALVGLIVGDAFLAAGGLALPEATLGLNPRRTVIPQLAGVGGATTGALLAAMLSDEAAPVARGAVIGSTVGLVGGGVVAAALPKRGKPRAGLELPGFDPPGTWSAFAGPGALEDGTPAIVANLSVTGW